MKRLLVLILLLSVLVLTGTLVSAEGKTLNTPQAFDSTPGTTVIANAY